MCQTGGTRKKKRFPFAPHSDLDGSGSMADVPLPFPFQEVPGLIVLVAREINQRGSQRLHPKRERGVAGVNWREENDQKPQASGVQVQCVTVTEGDQRSSGVSRCLFVLR